MTNHLDTSGGLRKKRWTPAYALRQSRHALTVITEKPDPSLVTGPYVTVARPDIAAGWPEGQRNQRFKLQTVSGEALPIEKEVFLTLTGDGAH